MHVLAWSNLDYVVCVHLIGLPPGETGEKQAGGHTGGWEWDLLELELELELGWSSRTQTGRTGEGEGWDQKRNPDWRHDPAAHAVWEWVSW